MLDLLIEIKKIKDKFNTSIINDFNNYKNTSFKSFNTETVNSPAHVMGNCIIISGNNVVHQLAFSGNDKIYLRRYVKSTDTWSEWKTINIE